MSETEEVGIRQGWLERGDTYTERCWFMINQTDSKLLYYSAERNAPDEDKCLGFVDLDDVKGVRTIEIDPNHGKDYAFAIETSKKTWVFAAESEEVRNRWVSTIENVKRARENGDKKEEECHIEIISIVDRTITFSWKIPSKFEVKKGDWIGLFVHTQDTEKNGHIKTAITLGGLMECEKTTKAPCCGCFDLRYFRDGDMVERSRSKPFFVGDEMELNVTRKDDEKKIVVGWNKNKQTMGEKTDWIGLYPLSESDNAKYIERHFTSEASEDGLLPFSFPTVPGTYELRYFFGKGKFLLYVVYTVYVNSGCSRITVGPEPEEDSETQVEECKIDVTQVDFVEKRISFSWRIRDGIELNEKDWIGVFVHNRPENSIYFGKVCTESRNGFHSFEVPCFGCFDLRYFHASESTESVHSEPIFVGPEMKLEVSYPSDPSNKSTIVVKWDKTFQTSRDWVGLYPVSELNNAKYKSWKNVPSKGDLVLDLPKNPGSYEVRYFFNRKEVAQTYVYSGLSNPIDSPRKDVNLDERKCLPNSVPLPEKSTASESSPDSATLIEQSVASGPDSTTLSEHSVETELLPNGATPEIESNITLEDVKVANEYSIQAIVPVEEKKVWFSWIIPDGIERGENDWIGLYLHNEENNSHYIDCRYVKDFKNGEYFFETYDWRGCLDLRYFCYKYEEKARSKPFFVGPEVELLACYKSDDDNKIVVRWQKNEPPKGVDQLRLFKVFDSSGERQTYIKQDGQKRDDGWVEFDLPKESGKYEVWYSLCKNKSIYAYSGRSNPIESPRNDHVHDIVYGVTKAVGICDYNARNSDELGFYAEDEIRIFCVGEGGMWYGECNGRSGWFPSSCVSVIVDSLVSSFIDYSKPSDEYFTPEEEREERDKLIKTPELIVSDWGTTIFDLNQVEGEQKELQPDLFYKSETTEFVVFFNNKFRALYEAIESCEKSVSGFWTKNPAYRRLEAVRSNLEKCMKDNGDCIKCDSRIAAFIVDKGFNTPGTIRIAPGGFYNNVERFLYDAIKTSQSAPVVPVLNELEKYLDGFKYMMRRGASLEETVDYCFVVRRVYHYVTFFETKKREYDYETLRTLVSLKKKLTMLVLDYCFPDEENYTSLNDVAINRCKVLVKKSSYNKIFIQLGDLAGFLERSRKRLGETAKKVNNEFFPGEMTEKHLAVTAVKGGDNTYEKEIEEKRKKIVEAKQKMNEYYANGLKAFGEIAAKSLLIVGQMIPVFSSVRSFYTSGLRVVDIGRKVISGLKSFVNSKDGDQTTTTTTTKTSSSSSSSVTTKTTSEQGVFTQLTKALGENGETIALSVRTAVQCYLDYCVKEEECSRYEEELMAIMKKMKRFENFSDFLTFYFSFPKFDSYDIIGVVVMWNEEYTEVDIID